MASSAQQLKARRDALVERCSDQRAQLAHDVATLASPGTLGLVPAYAIRHKQAALVAAGVAAALFVIRPKWAVGGVTAAVSLWQFALKVLPVLRWKGFDVH